MQDSKLVTSLYIHVPFCKSICAYCDFCKNFYNDKIVSDYLKALDKDVVENYKGEMLETIYVGGGTPSCLSYDQLNVFFKTIKRLNTKADYEFTFECNYEDINEILLELLKTNGVNRLSIGIETFNNRFSKMLNRKIDKAEMINKVKLAKEYFDNINLDLMYALPGERVNDLKKDIKTFASMDVNHISIYALIIEEHTKLYVDKTKETSDEKQAEMYEIIVDELSKYGYKHYEISNFSKPGFESKHNLTYWNNEGYYGFGAGASGFIGKVRYDNTRSIREYILGKRKYQKENITTSKMIEDELMLGLRKVDGVNYKNFKNKYGVSLKEAFDVDELLSIGFLKENKNNIYIPENMLFVSNEIIIKVLDKYNLNKPLN